MAQIYLTEPTNALRSFRIAAKERTINFNVFYNHRKEFEVSIILPVIGSEL